MCIIPTGHTHMHTHTNLCTFQFFFLQIWDLLHKASIQMGFVWTLGVWGALQSPRACIHMHSLVFFPTDKGGASQSTHREGFCTNVCTFQSFLHTLEPVDYNSFAMAIFCQNHREINFPELILVSRKVIIEGVSQWHYQQYGDLFDSWGKTHFFGYRGVSFPPNLI